MSDPENIMDIVDQESEPFPRQMTAAKDLFSFSFSDVEKEQKRIGAGANLSEKIDKAIEYKQNSDLSSEDIDQICESLASESDLVAFSHSARSSVIRL